MKLYSPGPGGEPQLYDVSDPQADHFARKIYREIFELGQYDRAPCVPGAGETVLDIGANIGAFTAWALERGAIVYAVDWPGYRDGYHKAMLQRIGERSGIETFIQEFEGWHDGKFFYSGGNASMVEACSMTGQTPCTCYRTVFTPIGPTGDVYFCHSLMYAGSNFGIIGNIFENWIDPVEKIRCDRFGWCNPCDKRRIDRP